MKHFQSSSKAGEIYEDGGKELEEEMDKRMQRINLLLDTIDKGMMNEETIGYFTYVYLQDLLVVTRQMDNGRKLYREIKAYLV